jgi:hypothetical protein
MSLHIDVDSITDVLLADGWHVVADQSFDLDAYEMLHGDYPVLRGGTVDGVPATGATWIDENDNRFWCPLTAILALKKSPGL